MISNLYCLFRDPRIQDPRKIGGKKKDGFDIGKENSNKELGGIKCHIIGHNHDKIFLL